jgi:Domain of unknown function (DUF1992)
LPVDGLRYARCMAWQRDPERPDPAEPSRQKVRETLVERQIREAMDDGRFDGLPHQGERLPLEEDSLSGDRAMAHRLLKNAGVAPGWIEADKHARVLIDERDRLLRQAPRLSSFARPRAREEFRRVVEAANRAILRVNIEAPTDRQQRPLLDIEVELARFERAARGERAD